MHYDLPKKMPVGDSRVATQPEKLENVEKSGNLIFGRKIREKSGNFSIFSKILEKSRNLRILMLEAIFMLTLKPNF